MPEPTAASVTLADLGHAEASATPGPFATMRIVCQCGREDDDRTRLVHERDVATAEVARLRDLNHALRDAGNAMAEDLEHLYVTNCKHCSNITTWDELAAQSPGTEHGPPSDDDAAASAPSTEGGRDDC